MRLLIINSEYPPLGGGAGNASANIAREMNLAGNEVVVLTAGFPGLSLDEEVDGARILRGPATRRRKDRSTASEQVVFMIGATVRALLLLRQWRPDCVLAFFGLPSGGVAWVLKRIFGIPYVISLRGGDVPGFRPYDFWLYHRIAVPFLREIWRAAGAVVANSEGLKRLGEMFDPDTRIAIVPNGVECERFWNPDRNWARSRLLSVGRLVHQKGLDLAISALARLTDIEWEWRIAGDGPQMQHLRERIRDAGLDKRVQLLGWMSHGDLIHEYGEAGVLVFPSRHEGMPNAVLEAMASGVAVVATRIAGNEELVVDGETGWLVPPEDTAALGAALEQLIANGEMRARMGKAAHARIAARYSWTWTASAYLRIIEEVLA